MCNIHSSLSFKYKFGPTFTVKGNFFKTTNLYNTLCFYFFHRSKQDDTQLKSLKYNPLPALPLQHQEYVWK